MLTTVLANKKMRWKKFKEATGIFFPEKVNKWISFVLLVLLQWLLARNIVAVRAHWVWYSPFKRIAKENVQIHQIDLEDHLFHAWSCIYKQQAHGGKLQLVWDPTSQSVHIFLRLKQKKCHETFTNALVPNFLLDFLHKRVKLSIAKMSTIHLRGHTILESTKLQITDISWYLTFYPSRNTSYYNSKDKHRDTAENNVFSFLGCCHPTYQSLEKFQTNE